VGFGDDAVVLDVELFLRAGAVLAFDDEVGGGEDGFESGVERGSSPFCIR
jgi:hypothetical protein